MTSNKTLEQQPKQKPVGWLTDRETMHFDKEDAWRDCDGFIQPLYTEPPKSGWVGLTDERVISLAQEWPVDETNDWASYLDFARAIEAAHGIKE